MLWSDKACTTTVPSMALFLCRLRCAESSGALRIPELTDMTADDRLGDRVCSKYVAKSKFNRKSDAFGPNLLSRMSESVRIPTLS